MTQPGDTHTQSFESFPFWKSSVDMDDASMSEGEQHAEATAMEEDDDPRSAYNKHTLPFILNTNPHSATCPPPPPPPQPAQQAASASSASATAAAAAELAARPRAEWTKEEKKRGRMCKTEGCENYIVHKGLCCRHGVRACVCTHTHTHLHGTQRSGLN